MIWESAYTVCRGSLHTSQITTSLLAALVPGLSMINYYTRPTTGHGGWLGRGAGVIDHGGRRRRQGGGEVELLWKEGVVHVTYGDPARGGQGNTTVGVLLNVPRLPYACHSIRYYMRI